MLMKKLSLILVTLLGTMTAQAQVETIRFSQPIHQLRVYDDTVFVSSDDAVSCYGINSSEGEEPQGWKPYLDTDAAVYDFVKYENRLLTAGTPDVHFYQNPLQPERVCKVEPATDGGYWAILTFNFWQWYHALWLPYNLTLVYNPQTPAELLGFGIDSRANCICPVLRHFSNGVDTWTNVDFELDEDRAEAYFTDMAYSPSTTGVVVAAMSTGLAVSEDGGVYWRYTSQAFPDTYFTNIVFDDRQPDIVYACGMSLTEKTDQILLRSTDGGRTWEAIYTLEKPLEGSSGIQGLRSYKGRLYFWQDDTVYVLSSPQDMTPITSDLVQPLRRGDIEGGKEELYDLQGQAVTTPQKGHIYIRHGRKMLIP